MTDVLLSTDDLTVIGGPQSVNVSVDIGSSGDRGSRIFVGNGNPNNLSTVIGQDVSLFDMYINLLSSDAEYSYMYQYQSIPSSPSGTWIKLAKLMPNVYSNKFNESFVDGKWTTNISVVGLSTTTILTAANLNVQYSISGNNPIASSITLGTLQINDGLMSLPITIFAKEFTGGDWVNPEGARSISIFITVV